MLEIVLKVTFVLGAASLAAVLLRRASPAVRHAMWTAALAGTLLLPLLPDAPPRRRIEIALPAATVAPGEPAASLDVATTSSPRPALPPLGMVWILGSLLAAARFFHSFVNVRRLTRCARPLMVHDGIAVMRSPRITAPFTWGMRKPVILLPEDSAAWTPERLRLVLSHEAVHVARHDWATQILAQLASVVYWFHPLVWFAATRMRREQELACDDVVVRAGFPPLRYAEHLLDLSRNAAVSARIPAGAPMADFRQLEVRMKSLLNVNSNRKPLNVAAAGWIAAALALVLIPLAQVAVRAQAQGTVRGAVKDPSGARVPQATLLLEGPNGREIASSGPDGAYSFAGVAPGTYSLTALSPGFARWLREIRVPGNGTEVDVTLEMGRIQETVEVKGNRPKPAAPVPAGTPQRIRVGGHVQASKLLVRENPVYPQELQDQGVEGTVLLDAVIGTSGTLLSLRPANTQVHPGLVKAAMEAVSQWRFQPTLLNGQPVEIITSITVRFRLPG